MTFGALIRNGANDIVIDSNYINLNIIQRGVATRDVFVDIPSRDIFPHIFYKIPRTTKLPQYNVPMGLVSSSSVSPRSRFGFTGDYRYVPATLEYAVASIGIPASPPSDTFGMKVWNASGDLAFGNMYNQPQIVTVASSRNGSAVITVPSSTQDYWISVPSGATRADSWYDGFQEIMDVWSAGAYWINDTTIGTVGGVTYQYPIGGAYYATHEDCYETDITVMVAIIK